MSANSIHTGPPVNPLWTDRDHAAVDEGAVECRLMTTGPESPLLVFCTCPDDAVARAVAATLVSQRLAACVTRLPAAISTYRWKGEVQHDDEVLLLIKTTPARYPALEKKLVEVHPYELPEILAVDVTTGLPDYLAWIEESTTS